MESPDRMELEHLRMSVVRMAQAVGVETEKLRILDASFDELMGLIKGQERGWNTLCMAIISKVEEERKGRKRWKIW